MTPPTARSAVRTVAGRRSSTRPTTKSPTRWIAAWDRARPGESKSAGKASSRDPKSASQRGGERSHSSAEGPTRDQLYEEAKKRNIHGRSSMTKRQLENALGR
ncbi:plasmid stabilization protein [Streptomyces sp. NPDC058964]|uniref:plasmid stabilization protein n=1 Tax=Streptomyces sp. NPDC058964 TaxID=3346681 RepID=UPI0036A692C3